MLCQHVTLHTVNEFHVFDQVVPVPEGEVAQLAVKQYWHSMMSQVCLEQTFSNTLVAVHTPDCTLRVPSHVGVYVAHKCHLYPGVTVCAVHPSNLGKLGHLLAVIVLHVLHPVSLLGESGRAMVALEEVMAMDLSHMALQVGQCWKNAITVVALVFFQFLLALGDLIITFFRAV